jgi:hypothetical protein
VVAITNCVCGGPRSRCPSERTVRAQPSVSLQDEPRRHELRRREAGARPHHIVAAEDSASECKSDLANECRSTKQCSQDEIFPRVDQSKNLELRVSNAAANLTMPVSWCSASACANLAEHWGRSAHTFAKLETQLTRRQAGCDDAFNTRSSRHTLCQPCVLHEPGLHPQAGQICNPTAGNQPQT